MFKKPNRNQAVYIATLLATIAVGFFTWMGFPALVKVVDSAGLPDSMYVLVCATLFTIILLVFGYLMLDENASRKD